MWPGIINGFCIYYMLNVCVLSHYLNPVVEIWITICDLHVPEIKKTPIKCIEMIFHGHHR